METICNSADKDVVQEICEVMRRTQECYLRTGGLSLEQTIQHMSPIEFGNFVGNNYGIYSDGALITSCSAMEG